MPPLFFGHSKVTPARPRLPFLGAGGRVTPCQTVSRGRAPALPLRLGKDRKVCGPFRPPFAVLGRLFKLSQGGLKRGEESRNDGGSRWAPSPCWAVRAFFRDGVNVCR